jgi:CRISPR-associated endonuclease/helicase Cas3
MHGTDQSLAIVNTRRQATDLLGALDDPDAFHLSTYMCSAHRRKVLDAVRDRLRPPGLPCRLVSTQVIEAGVDLDFPLVLRAVGPLDRIVQAAGRCNREGRLPEGLVVVFTPEDDQIPRGVYRTASDIARTMLSDPGVDLHDPEVFRTFFRALYAARGGTDAEGIEALRGRLDFPSVARRFRIISDDTLPVAVPYGDATRVLDALDDYPGDVRLWRRLQGYLVQVHLGEAARLEQEGLIVQRPSGARAWTGHYDERIGIGLRAADASQHIIG